jgi:hypothetical protein
MLDLETLRISDIYHWFGRGEEAGAHIGCDQSTISRNAKKVRMLKSNLISIGGEDLINMEREVHQNYRFKKGTNLRLHTYKWTNYLIGGSISDDWEINPLSVSATKTPGLGLLKERIIDAICAPYPLVANTDRNIFTAIKLYSTHLQLFAHKDAVLANERNLSTTDINAATRLGRLNYVPTEASECSTAIDAQIFNCKGEQQVNKVYDSRYWGTPLTPIISKDLQPVTYNPICPYAEYLVVLKEWEEHPLVAKLKETIGKSLITGIGAYSASELINIES